MGRDFYRRTLSGWVFCEDGKMTSAEWLESLQVGDEVVLNRVFGGHCIEKIEKITKTQIVTNNGRYRRSTGITVCGSIWHLSKIEPITEQIRDEVKKRRICAIFSKQNFAELSLDKLERIKAIIHEG